MPEAAARVPGRRARPAAVTSHAARLVTLLVSMQAALLLLPAWAAPGTPPQAAAAQTWRVGTLDLHPCEIGGQSATGVPSQSAYCTRFDVPEDWAAPGGRHIALRVALVRSLALEAERDMVVFLDGGPGGAATEDYAAVASALRPLRKHHDILLVDQRGTGGSNPLSCGDELVLDADKPAPPHRRGKGADAGALEPSEREQLARIRQCLDTLAARAAPQFYTTTDAVRDLAAVRQALGSPPFDLVGVSYGTRVAQQYAARYPQSVRSIVLDSPVPNRLVLLSEFAVNLEDALQRRLARCAAEPACARRYGDSYHKLHEVLDRLRRNPQPVEMHDPQSFDLERETLSADDLAGLVRFYLYASSTSALLPLVIDEAASGRYAPLLSQAKLMAGDISEKLNGGMSASVLCAEDADLLHEQPQDERTVLGSGMVRSARVACQVWPHRPRPADFHRAFVTSVPVLVLGGEFDPVTPPRYGTEIAAALAHARVLVAPGQGHAVIGIGCMPKLVGDFVEHLDPAGLDAGCLEALGDTPAFLNVNGAAP